RLIHPAFWIRKQGVPKEEVLK
ncbi:hypothetical protein NPIL_44881, partial [Nephila pilipes]